MEFGAIQAATGGFLLLLALAVVWMACRLKQKNEQLRKALEQLQLRKKEACTAAEPSLAATPEAVPVTSTLKPPPPVTPAACPLADAFLWEHLGDAFLWKHLSNNKPVPIDSTPIDPDSLPNGLCDRATLQPLLESDHPFTGLVVLVGITATRIPRTEHPAQPFIADLLGPADCACRYGNDEFLIICPALRGAEAQRRLNEISERLWTFQLRGQGSFSVLFSWGGIGAGNERLSEAVQSATERMRQTKRSRVLFFTRKAG